MLNFNCQKTDQKTLFVPAEYNTIFHYNCIVACLLAMCCCKENWLGQSLLHTWQLTKPVLRSGNWTTGACFFPFLWASRESWFGQMTPHRSHATWVGGPAIWMSLCMFSNLCFRPFICKFREAWFGQTTPHVQVTRTLSVGVDSGLAACFLPFKCFVRASWLGQAAPQRWQINVLTGFVNPSKRCFFPFKCSAKADSLGQIVPHRWHFTQFFGFLAVSAASGTALSCGSKWTCCCAGAAKVGWSGLGTPSWATAGPLHFFASHMLL